MPESIDKKRKIREYLCVMHAIWAVTGYFFGEVFIKMLFGV